MNKLEKMRLFLASCMMGMAVSIVSCSSENGENDILDGKGTIRLGMSTGVDFGVTTTRSVNLADYQDKNNYTVQILKSDGTTPVHEFTYADMPSIPLELDNGTYMERKKFLPEMDSVWKVPLHFPYKAMSKQCLWLVLRLVRKSLLILMGQWALTSVTIP